MFNSQRLQVLLREIYGLFSEKMDNTDMHDWPSPSGRTHASHCCAFASRLVLAVHALGKTFVRGRNLFWVGETVGVTSVWHVATLVCSSEAYEERRTYLYGCVCMDALSTGI